MLLGTNFLYSSSHLGWFARNPTILNRVGKVLLQLPDVAPTRPTYMIIAEDCFQLSSTPYDVVTQTVIEAVTKLYGGEQIIN